VDEALRAELLAMQAEDQAMRLRAAPDGAQWDPEVDRRHTARLKEMVRERGFPGRSLVGADGASAAWLIAQHSSHDREFQREFLSLMEVAVAAGEAEPRHYAYLTDRIRLASGQPQVYGTQYHRDGQYILLCPIEDPERLDERRHGVGLRGAAEYLASALAWEEVQRTYQIPNPNVRCGETAPGLWRAVVFGGETRVRVDIAWDPARQGCHLVGGPEREP